MFSMGGGRSVGLYVATRICFIICDLNNENSKINLKREKKEKKQNEKDRTWELVLRRSHILSHIRQIFSIRIF